MIWRVGKGPAAFSKITIGDEMEMEMDARLILGVSGIDLLRG